MNDMDEELRRQQQAQAAFGTAPAQDPQQAVADIKARGAANAPVPGDGAHAGENMARIQDETARSANLLGTGMPEAQSWGVPGADASLRQQFGAQVESAFGPAAPAPQDPTRLDPALGEGLDAGTRDAIQTNFDENLKAARDAVARQSWRGGRFAGASRRDGSGDEISAYRDRLLKLADETMQRQAVDKTRERPADPYAPQREREALVARRLGTFDLFSDAKATRTPISAQTVQTQAYDKVLMGNDNRDLFDSFL